MTKKIISTLALGLSLFASTTAVAELRQNAEAQNRASPFMQEYGRALPPIGHIGFCRRFPAECAPIDALHKRVEATSDMRQDLTFVNDLVNEMIRPMTDQELYGRIEHWTYPAGMGDCEDYVLLKRRLLMERGWPASALLITVVRDENSEGHAILTVRTAAGDFILDNKRPGVTPWNKSVYTFVKRQAHWDPQTWVSLSAPAPRQHQGVPVSTSKK